VPQRGSEVDIVKAVGLDPDAVRPSRLERRACGSNRAPDHSEKAAPIDSAADPIGHPWRVQPGGPIYNADTRIIMPRLRRPVAVLCIAVIVAAAFLPGMSAADGTVFEPSWVLLPDLASVFVPATPDRALAQPRALLALLPSRAPPA
jgi:hypothetical protein